MVSTIPSQPAGVRRSVRLSSLSIIPFDVYCVVVDPTLENRYQSTMDMHLGPRGWLILLWELTRRATAEALGEELL
jgi:hypothetical protein